MNSEFTTLNLPDLELILAKSSCSCHFINPNKTRIILWKEEKNGSETYYLRIGIQKFISYPLYDKNGAIYWRFNKGPELKGEVNQPDPLTKFQQRQVKTESLNNHGNNSESSATNDPQ